MRSSIACGIALLAAACSPTYVTRAAIQEAKILRARRPIAEVVHDTTTSSPTRAKLRLVQAARDFATRQLGLNAGKSFTSFAEVDRDTLVLVVTAAPAYQLTWKTWWFPIVGRVPYRGYFEFDRARREADRLKSEGYDVYVRPSSAFSTLGWLPDPLLSSMLQGDSVYLAETVIHEITHTTYFPSGEVEFNESFANFVGQRGAIAFFCEAVNDSELCRVARDRWHDSRVLARFYTSLADSLRALYAQPLPPDSMAAGKRRELEEAAKRFNSEVRPQLVAAPYAALDGASLNNAWLLARVLYNTRLDDFEAIYEDADNLRSSVQEIIRTAKATSPWAAVDSLAQRSRATPAVEGNAMASHSGPRGST